MKKPPKQKREAVKERGMGVILESLDSKIDLLVESHLGLVQGQEGLNKKADRVENKLDKLQQEMDYKFEVVFDELHLIRNDLKEKVSREEFLVLEKRVAHLEKKTSHSQK